MPTWWSSRGTAYANVGRPVTLDGLEIVVTASAGVALIDGDHEDGAPLRYADIAMFNAKTQRLGVEVYRDEIDRRTPARLSMLGDLRAAIEDDELQRAPAAQARPRLGHGRRRRGAGAVDPPGPRHRVTGSVRQGGRGHRADQAAHRRHAPSWHRPPSGDPRPWISPRAGREPVDPRPARHETRPARRATPRTRTVSTVDAHARDHRVVTAHRRTARHEPPSTSSTKSASACRSTTSAPATRRSATCAGCPWRS